VEKPSSAGSPDFVLSRYEFDVLWRALGFGPMPYPLAVSRVGSAQFTDEVYRGLADQGLVHGRTIEPRLAHLLRLLGEYDVAIHAVGDIGYQMSALAAASRESGVLAVLAGGELWLTGIGRDAMAAAIAGVLLASARSHQEAVGGGLAEAAGASRVHGRFGVSPAHRRPKFSACWLNTPRGRYLLVRKGSLASIGPADSVSVERCLAAALAESDAD
jgi:hypothetical protein